MKKNLLWTVAAALTLMSCAADDLMNESAQANESNAITFSTYVNKTRAAVIDKDHIKLHGFGVNAYYTQNTSFAEAFDGVEGTKVQTFMDDTKVYYDEIRDCWTYSPIKYWPNNVNDSLSFFAYAPYKSERIEFPNPNNRSTLVFTVANDVKEQVDLIYHKAQGDNAAGIEQTVDLKKPSINSTVNFNFLHALSRIAFDVKAIVDDTDTGSDNLLDGNTRININKVALIPAEDDYEAGVGPFYTAATLSILNGEWSEHADATQGFEFDGDDFYRAVDAEGASVVQLTKFNPAQRLLTEDSYLMIIPQDFTEDGYRIYIEYDVISEEVNNNGTEANTTSDNSTISHKIYSDVMNTNFVAGQAYIFNLRLGMTSVKFDAEVTDWTEEAPADVWVPENNL